jgi:DNA-binding CsgD family transcriptional regulator
MPGLFAESIACRWRSEMFSGTLFECSHSLSFRAANAYGRLTPLTLSPNRYLAHSGCVRGAHVKVIRRNDQPHNQERHPLTPSSPRPPHESYFFYEQSTGVSHFHVDAGPDGQFPVQEAAGLLAMHRMVRGQSPRDYVVMVEAAHESLKGLVEKAEKSLQAGHSVGSSVKLTRREEEVLSGVTRSLANKEIAATLNLSERTVKFHVSSLLTKFRVRGRMELAREATRRIPTMTGPQSFMTQEARRYTPIPASYHSAPRVGPIALAKRQPMALS